jgi:hypothetical protein
MFLGPCLARPEGNIEQHLRSTAPIVGDVELSARLGFGSSCRLAECYPQLRNRSARQRHVEELRRNRYVKLTRLHRIWLLEGVMGMNIT